MSGIDRARLTQAVQRNCHIADARHAEDMTLCTYLLQMREFHRWERAAPWDAALPRDEVGHWIAEREALWSRHEDSEFAALPLAQDSTHAELDPFDVQGINARLRHEGLLYGAGLVGVQRPVFFLAELHAEQRREGLLVLSAGRELARGLLAPPAVLARSGDDWAIVLRREALARWCWEKFEAFSLRRPSVTSRSPFHAAVQAYGLDGDFAAALPRWLDDEGEALVLHEIGEYRAGQQLGPAWATMRLALPSRRAELYARALRDHLADLAVTLPTLLERDAQASIHVWFANFDGVRSLLFPTLPTAYEAWRAGDGARALKRAIELGQAHFSSLARGALALYAQDGDAAGASIEQLLTAPAAVCRG